MGGNKIGLWLCMAIGLVLAWGAAGCGNPATPNTDHDVLASIDVEWMNLGGAHHYGETTCPQNVGSILLTNTGTVTTSVDVTETASQLRLLRVDASGGATPFTGPVTLAAGESFELRVEFDCSMTVDIATNIHVTATPMGGTADSLDIPFALDIQGAP